MLEYFSQYGQDKFIAQLLKFKKGGVFLDIGAYDGVNFSNTFFFEKSLQWTGICVEPNPDIYKSLIQKRKCVCVNSCIASEKGVVEYLSITGYGSMLSGIVSFYDDRALQRIDETIAAHGGTKKIINISSLPVSELLSDYNITYLDYCNIDVEGGEMSVLKSIDFSKVKIKFFSIENNYGTKTVKNYLKTLGYSLIGKIGSDEIYELHSRRFLSIILFQFKPLLHFISQQKAIMKTKISSKK